MLKIKLVRKGAKGQPSYRIVVVDGAKRGVGKFIKTVGFYDPKTKPETIKLDNKEISLWLGKGAKPTETVRKLIE